MTESVDRGESRVALGGVIEHVTFHNPDNGFCVLRVRGSSPRRLFTAVGFAASVSPGEHVQMSGDWKHDPEHGVQFRARHLQISPPSTTDGIRRYLGSGLIHGIGKTYAKRLVAAFGADVFEVIENHPARLRQVPGIGPKRSGRIIAGWQEQKAIREIMVFLQSHGVSTARAVRIFKTYGADALPLILEDPYRLARDIRGIGFPSADQIAGRLGVAPTSPHRARAGLAHTLLEALSDGHCGLPQEELLRRAGELLDVSEEVLQSALREEVEAGSLVADTAAGRPTIFLPPLHQAERRIAEQLLALADGPPPWKRLDAESALAAAESRLDLRLAPGQRSALLTVLERKVAVLTGGPGVGKTTVVRALLESLAGTGVEVRLCAPTGRAAKRLAESTGREAQTIHRLLGAGPKGFQRDASNPLECALLIVDETSMVDVRLLASLLAALPRESALVLIGDANQLPPVGPGQPLADIIRSRSVPVLTLDVIFRQAAASRIVRNAHRVHHGDMPDLESGRDGRDSDFYFVPATSPDDALAKIERLVTRRIPDRFGLHPTRDIQVLSPMARAILGTRNINQRLQAVLNPPQQGAPTVERFGLTYRAGDKVIQTENDYDRKVFNGDLGVVAGIDPGASEIFIRFDGTPLSYRFDELDQIALAYALTIHKSQGSEYPAVVIPLSTQHFPLLQRNLLYTAMTRGKRLVVLVGEERAVRIAVRRDESGRRVSMLAERLRHGAAEGAIPPPTGR